MWGVGVFSLFGFVVVNVADVLAFVVVFVFNVRLCVCVCVCARVRVLMCVRVLRLVSPAPPTSLSPNFVSVCTWFLCLSSRKPDCVLQ